MVAPDGVYTYTLVAKDAGDATVEGSGTVTVATPDLTITSLTHDPVNPRPNFAVTMTAVVKNIGAAKVGGSTLQIEAGGAKYASSVASLAAGAMKTVNKKVTLPAGSYTVTATIDSANLIGEKDESNNLRTDSFTVQ